MLLYNKLPFLRDGKMYVEVFYEFVKLEHMTYIRWFHVKIYSMRYSVYAFLEQVQDIVFIPTVWRLSTVSTLKNKLLVKYTR